MAGAGGLGGIETAIGHAFANPDLLREALTHPSLATDQRGAARFGYERLEFLGDRVLGLVIAAWLVERFRDENEGKLAKRHASLVRRDALAEVAGGLGLGAWLRMSTGEEDGGGRENQATLADGCEALIGAVFLDGGLAAAEAFIRGHWQDLIDRDARPPEDPKTLLQERVQAKGLPVPEYREVGRRGPDHNPEFQIEVRLASGERAQARAGSKRLAEKQAAAAMLAILEQGS